MQVAVYVLERSDGLQAGIACAASWLMDWLPSVLCGGCGSQLLVALLSH
jgi:hypothetical protein